MLNNIKDHINNLARTIEKLDAVRDSASDWQKQAIDRSIPLMKDLAANTTAAINHLNENKTRPTSSNYTEYLKENAETAHELSDMISVLRRCGMLGQGSTSLSKSLRLPVDERCVANPLLAPRRKAGRLLWPAFRILAAVSFLF